MITWTGGLIIAFGGAIGLVRFAGRNPAEAVLEAALASLALGAILAAPGILLVLAGADRPALLVPVAVALVPLSLISMAGVLLPLLIPAVLLFVAYGRRRHTQPPPVMPVAVTTVAVLSCLVAALFVLLAHPDPRSWTTATGGGSTSDVITAVESLGALVMVVAAIAVGEVFSRPVRPAPG